MVNAAELIARVKKRRQELRSWEWWDHSVSGIITHPSIDRSSSDQDTKEGPELALTRDERRKKRKLERANAREDQRMKVELGIEQPPGPKISRKNVATVFGASYVQDPTKYEILASEAEDERRRAHIEANESRKLSKEQVWEKTRTKLETHRRDSLRCAAFSAPEELTSKQQYIIDYTAKKFLCTGACLMGPKDAFLIFEAGETEINKIKKLMAKILTSNLIWQGALPSPNFKKWSMHSTPHRWEFAKKHNVESLYEQSNGDLGPDASLPTE